MPSAQCDQSLSSDAQQCVPGLIIEITGRRVEEMSELVGGRGVFF